MKTTIINFIFTLFVVSNLFGQTSFNGRPGIYVLGLVDQNMSTTEYSKIYVAGTAVRTKWESIETSPGVFNWKFLNDEITNASKYNRKISILIIGAPSWLASQGVPMYSYIDKKPTSPTYLDTLQAPITWSSQYVARLTNLIQQLGLKYANDTTVTYINCISGNMNNNMPSTVASGANFWTNTGYHRDTLVAKMKQVLDVYMISFPNTPCWNSLENISFEMIASGNPNNYVIKQFADYGVSTYPDRFGVWREDLSGCSNTTSSTGHWGVIASYPSRTGSQMLWNVQDGPTRMNQCGLSSNTKDFVLQSAFNKGFTMKMIYFEVYKVDIDDTTLSTTLQKANDSCIALSKNWNTTDVKDEKIIPKEFNLLQNYPNPFNPTTEINFNLDKNGFVNLKVYNLMGREISTLINQKMGIGSHSTKFDATNLTSGIYFYTLTSNGRLLTKKMILLK